LSRNRDDVPAAGRMTANFAMTYPLEDDKVTR
jgi:hypothetical protein